jgi:SSS family solute:Na+ symporter
MGTHVVLSAALVVLPLYFGVTLLVGWLSGRSPQTAQSYLSAGRSLPLWVVTAAYLAANCGALEIVGLSAMAAQYGAQAFQFYWIGAIPGMIFLALWMMPVYRRSGVRSVPEYLELRYGPSLRLINACVLGTTMLLLGGISLYAMAQTLEVMVGLSFAASISIAGGVVLLYVLLGGIKATIYNEVFQLGVMVAGIAPIAWIVMRRGLLHGDGFQMSKLHMWSALPVASTAAPLDVLGVVVGLGFVLSFGYWCTDFVQMQRAFTARTEDEARQVPLWAGFGKIGFSMIVVLPGLAAARIFPGLGHGQRFDQALALLMTKYYGPLLLALGLTALAASLMSGLAANVSAFAAIWTEDIYRSRLRRHETDRHYLVMGRLAAIVAIVVCLLTSYIDFLFSNLMEHVQLIFSIFGSPFWAIFLMGMTSRRVTEKGAVVGFLSGATVALLHLLAFTAGWIEYGSMMNANFHAAIYAFCTAVAIGWGVSLAEPRTSNVGRGNDALRFEFVANKSDRRLWLLAGTLLVSCVLLNWYWR